MPWRGPEYPGEFPTLGYQVAEWIQTYCVIPDREDAGLPFVLTEEQLRILLFHYRLNPEAEKDPSTGRWQRAWVYDRGSQVRRPQKWGKAPLSSAVGCVEAAPDGPVLFDGWDASGEPVGRAWATPHIQVTACSEDQTDNIWRALLPMIQLGPLADVFPDFGLSRINLPTGGLIEPVTAAAISRLGQRVTLALQDQTESWTQTNGGWKLADNQRRGLAGTGGRFFETPNAHDPVEQSVAQRTAESSTVGVYMDVAEPPPGSVRNKRERRRVLEAVYGDSTVERGGWIDLDRIDSEIEALLEYDAAQAERWFLNRCLASEGAAFNFEKFKTLASKRKPEKRTVITIGVDGARREDALAIVATEVKTGFMWPLGIWERPKDAGDDYEHPHNEVDGAMLGAFEQFNVWRVYIDDQWIDHLVELWANRWGDKRIKAWHTNRQQQIAWAVRELEQAIGAGDVSHDGSPVFSAHVMHARKRMLTVRDDKERFMHTLSKDSIRSPRKIDAAMAAVLSWKARGDAIEAGVVVMDKHQAREPEPVERWEPGHAPNMNRWGPAQTVGPMGNLS